MKTIHLTQGKVALVDDEDYEWLSQWEWCAYKEGKTFYVLRNVKANGRWTTVRMHREIMGNPSGMEVDHVDRNGLNNTRANLRLCTRSEQNGNTLSRGGSSRFKGVCWHKQARKWHAQIKIDGRNKSLGLHDSEIDAACAYDAAAAKTFGRFARVNFPLPGELPALVRGTDHE